MQYPEILQFQKVSKTYGTKTVLKDLDLGVRESEIFVLIGGSGSGKTTALKIINGLVRPDEGRVLYKDQVLAEIDLVQHRRNLGFAIQGSGLFPHLKMIDNVSLIARRVGWSEGKIRKRAEELFELVNLDPSSFFYKYPHQMSGGQQQRVGIVRALFLSPQILLMDEAFGALDPITRKEIQNEFLRLHKQLKFTSVVVTHDLSEAFRLGTRMCLLNEGKIEQIGAPNELLLSPRSEYVQAFIKAHSPGQVLEEIRIHSVLNANVFKTVECRPGQYEIKNMQTGQSEGQVFDRDSLLKWHQENQQSFVYMCSAEGLFLKVVGRESGEEIPKEKMMSIGPEDTFLVGLTTLLDSPFSQLPVVDLTGQFQGVFSEDAIRAL